MKTRSKKFKTQNQKIHKPKQTNLKGVLDHQSKNSKTKKNET